MTNNTSTANIRWSDRTIASSARENSCSSTRQASWRLNVRAGCTSIIARL